MLSDRSNFDIHFPQTPTQGQQANPANQAAQSTGRKPRQCGICKQTGHDRRNCPNKVKTNRTGLNKPSIFPAIGANKRARGTIEVVKRIINEDKEKYVYQTSWMDSKPVHVLSTFGGGLYTSVGRNSVSQNGQYAQIQVPRPSIIGTYNATMGGTDKFDQLEQYYDDRHRTLHWQLRIILHFLRAAVINAKILYESKFPAATNLTLEDFMRRVIREWTEDIELSDEGEEEEHVDSDSSDDEQPTEEAKRHFKRKSRAWWRRHFSERNYYKGVHFPIHCKPRSEKGPRGKPGHDYRKKCKICSNKTSFLCDQCGVGLCISTDKNSTIHSCFHEFHCYGDFTL